MCLERKHKVCNLETPNSKDTYFMTECCEQDDESEFCNGGKSSVDD